jgi:hypothetical protein
MSKVWNICTRSFNLPRVGSLTGSLRIKVLAMVDIQVLELMARTNMTFNVL